MTKETESKTDVEREANAAPDKTTNRSTVLAMGAILTIRPDAISGDVTALAVSPTLARTLPR